MKYNRILKRTVKQTILLPKFTKIGDETLIIEGDTYNNHDCKIKLKIDLNKVKVRYYADEICSYLFPERCEECCACGCCTMFETSTKNYEDVIALQDYVENIALEVTILY